jgi:tetratricopeptide (TPR) repeat protein
VPPLAGSLGTPHVERASLGAAVPDDADQLARFKTALADRYRVERELGHGGMALVYLAEDLKNHRRVAIKVLRPEIAAALGPERFLREIATVAQLTHPNILPLHDSGEAVGLLYYVTPYLEGESLRDRLAREHQLPIDVALHITHEVADALGYAHAHGIVHRDIKPENILFQAGHAVVGDFGIARAVTSAGGETLTETGIAIGTPAYMSPEQASAEKNVDARSDIYSLGCVLYEMLGGQPPFTGRTAQAIQARRMTDPVPPLHTVRETVPAHIEEAILKALAKVPADRFVTATHFVDALTQPPGAPSPDRERGTGGEGPWRRIAWTGAVAAALVLVVWVARHQWSKQSVALDPNLVVVLPFRVTGADSTLSEGMVDLLAAKLTGEGGPRAASPQSVISAWRRAARANGGDLTQDETLRLAQRLGAGKLLLGSLVGTTGRLIVSASLLGATSGREEAGAHVEGPPDSLLGLVDQMTSQLLVAGARVGPSLASLTSASLPALRAYLEGRAAYRRGRWKDAVFAFKQSVRLDTTFALAARDLVEAAGWYDYADQDADVSRGMRLAWLSHDRLSAPEQLMLEAYGPRHSSLSSQADVFAARESLVKVVPDRPEAWQLLGDHLFHWGAFIGLPDAHPRAAAAFRRALEIDSTIFVEPLLHLVHISALEGDTAAVRRYATLVIATDSQSELAEYLRWLLAHELHDGVFHLDSMSSSSLGRIITWQMLEGDASQDAERAVIIRAARASTTEARAGVKRNQAFLGLNAGHPPTRGGDLDGVYGLLPPYAMAVFSGLYWDGDSAASIASTRELARYADATPPRTSRERALQYQTVCTLEQWRVLHGQFTTAVRAISHLRSASVPADGLQTVERTHVCALLLDAMLAAALRSADGPGLTNRLDSLMKTGPQIWWAELHAANLVVARLREAEGNLPAALAAVRRRGVHITSGHSSISLHIFARKAASRR